MTRGPALVSVAMCTYNGAEFLDEQLTSIAEQTQLPGELVIRDDASSDGTLALVRAFAARAPFPVTVIENERNVGTTANFELVLRDCRFPTIALADQDDVWMPGKLETMSAVLSASPDAVAAFSDARLVDEQGRHLEPRLWEAVGLTPTLLDGFADGGPLRDPFRNYVTGATMVIQARLLPLLLPVDRTIPGVIHDGWFAYLASVAGLILPVAEPLIDYRQHPGQQLGVLRNAFVPNPGALPKTGLRRVLPHERTLEALERGQVAYRTILQRACLFPELTSGAKRADLARRCEHLARRLELAAKPLPQRIGLTLAEVVRGNYHRYAHDRLAPLRDVIGGS